MVLAALAAVAIAATPSQSQARRVISDVTFGQATVYGCVHHKHRDRCFVVEAGTWVLGRSGIAVLQTNVRERWTVWRYHRSFCAQADGFDSASCVRASAVPR
jgi:hypothetical protein